MLSAKPFKWVCNESKMSSHLRKCLLLTTQSQVKNPEGQSFRNHGCKRGKYW